MYIQFLVVKCLDQALIKHLLHECGRGWMLICLLDLLLLLNLSSQSVYYIIFVQQWCSCCWGHWCGRLVSLLWGAYRLFLLASCGLCQLACDLQHGAGLGVQSYVFGVPEIVVIGLSLWRAESIFVALILAKQQNLAIQDISGGLRPQPW